MREQAQIAIDTADVIVFITDVQQGLVDSDAKVADMLRRSQKPVVLVVNKVDSVQKYMMDVYEFYNLGIGEPIPISAANRTGLGDMLDEIVKEFPEGLDTEEDDDIPKIAVVGKPNVGKSFLINRLLGEDRVIVSDIAGTTRDAVDAKVKWQGKEYIFIDTAGLRRKGKIKEEIERYSVIRTVTAVERAHVVVIVIDATEGVTEQSHMSVVRVSLSQSINGMQLRRMTRLFTSTQTVSGKCWRTCRMQNLYSFPPKQVSVCRSCLRQSMRSLRTRHFVFRQVS